MKQEDLHHASALSAQRARLLESLKTLEPGPAANIGAVLKGKPNANAALEPVEVNKYCIAKEQLRNYMGGSIGVHYNEVVSVESEFVKLAIQMKLAEIERELVQLGVVL